MPFATRRRFLARLAAATGSLSITPVLSGCGGGGEDLDAVAPAAESGTAQALSASLPSTDWRMPEESEPHAATWMAFGSSTSVWGRRLHGPVQEALAEIANAVVDFEAVNMLVRPAEMNRAKNLLDAKVRLIPCALDDLWLRDSGCVFVKHRSGVRGAVDFNFNGWGGKQTSTQDRKVAALMANRADRAGTRLLTTRLVLEGGSIEVDGQGTALLTESAVLNPNRNPGLGKAAVEAELKRLLGLRKIIWLPGIAGRDITDGHIDFYARFVRPGVVVAAREDDPSQFDHAVTRRHLELLRAATDADGRRLQVIELPGPERVRSAFDNDDFAAGYVNYYVGNGAVFMPQFGDTRADGLAQERLQAAYPQREIVPLNIDAIAAGGGGIHCTTQQQPA